MKLDTSAVTDPGMKRITNEDYVWSQVFMDSQGLALGLFIVCDGMGGHLGGECASYWATEAIKRELSVLFCPGDPRATLHLSREAMETEARKPETPVRMTEREIESLALSALQKANHVVLKYAQVKHEQAAEAGTTVCIVIVQGKKAMIANIGDSRAYLLRAKQLRQVTKDHSLVANLVASGQLEPDEIYDHPQRNMIYRSLGQKEKIQPDIFWEDLEPGDQFLLCSDGLWEMIRDHVQIVQIIDEARTLDQACVQLVEAANEAGGEDNISVVLAKII
jgi:protein phosphatase